MNIIDFHNHFYPPEYLSEIQTGPGNVKITFDSDNNPLLHYPGDYNIVVIGHKDIVYREQVLYQNGIETQVLSFTTPGTHIESPKRAVILARMVNDVFAKIIDERGDYFSALATLPLNDPTASVRELERAVSELGFKGVMLFSNVNGKALSDKEYWPLYEKAEDLDVVFYIHPIHPVGVEAMREHWLMPLVGFTFDTTLAASKLVFSGIVEKFPKIKWILAHLGGAIPFIVERLDRGYNAFKECRENISKPPSEFLKKFYYDSVNFDLKSLQLAIDFAGADHIVAGSDYPHQIGSLKKMVESIDQLNISEEDKGKISRENVIKLLNLKK
ncbi:MAG: amidohydrolase family protein [Candidatus Hodarchaeales archaeon]|jgi:aminocarboxymuconate-semialdehyde decarboxylase